MKWVRADVHPLTIKVVHNSCNMCTCVLPDMYTLIPRACGPRVYISGRTLMPMLQLLNVYPSVTWVPYTHVSSFLLSSTVFYIMKKIISSRKQVAVDANIAPGHDIKYSSKWPML